ncbi:MAG TPA: pyridoxamine 5'-phosphate oxidase family protein, partial [Cyclobacteriaceae bacterium]|nr:pyridoxamine 5'-phosphate oxidase family protein [Cyclobacteriaceae bacterium]
SDGREVSIVAMLVDGLVLARSAFHHSVNYRSVVLFSHARKVEDQEELYKSLEAFTEKMIPGRWKEIRQPNDGEWKKTMVLAFEISEASAKVRSGPPKDDEEDYDLPIWAGVLSLQQKFSGLIPDPELKNYIQLPEHLKLYNQ